MSQQSGAPSRGQEGVGPSQPVVHMRGDSDSNLQALFDVLKSGGDQTPSPHSTWGNRKLPQSFFKPPEPGSRGSHSREGSQDSSAGGFAVAPRQVSGLIPNHGRSRSSPATLPISIATPNPGPIHIQQKSVDLGDGQLRVESPLHSLDGQRYFLNQPWQPLDHRKSNSNHSLNSGAGPQNVTPTLSPSQSLQHSPAVSQTDLGPLPAGWEQGMTLEGEVYFINHVEKTTSWFDPRIPSHLQKPGPRPAVQQQQQPPVHQQNVLSGQSQNALQTSSQHSPNPSASPLQQQPRRPLPNDKYIQLELQKLQREKDRLQREQEEISQKESMLRDLMTQQCLIVSGNGPMSMADTKTTASLNTMQAGVTTSSVDPFLGHSGNLLESHARQNSADSGLGGMGTGYSLPRTPEDFLSNVDEMDTHDGGHKIAKHLTISSDFNMNELQNSMGMDLVGLGDPSDNPSGMDSDDLEPSLQDDISHELLNEMSEMDVPKMDNLLYL